MLVFSTLFTPPSSFRLVSNMEELLVEAEAINKFSFQKRLTDLEQQVSNMEYMLSNAIPSKSKNRSNRAIADNIVEDVYFSVVRSEVQLKQTSHDKVPYNNTNDQMLRCHKCPVTYARAHVNQGSGMHLETGVFTAPVSGSYYFQVRTLMLKLAAV